MPTKPGRLCSKRGCRGIVHGDVCSVCGKKPVRVGWNHEGTSTDRGYGSDWKRLRSAFIAREMQAAFAQGKATLTCAICGEPVAERDIHVDHIGGFGGRHDAARLDVGNMQVTHSKCNMRKAAQHATKQ